jgi:hypothetical protein
MTTIVSAFISSSNVGHRQIEEYIEYGKKLISINEMKIIFIEEEIYDIYLKPFIDDNILSNTTFIFTKKDDIYLYKYYDQIVNFNIKTDNSIKDTIDFMFIICNKTEWMREAVKKNPYKSEQFIWIDFGIYHVINNDTIMKESISELVKKRYDSIRIAGGYYNQEMNIEEVYNRIVWCFLGGIFGGSGDKLSLFADLMKDKCLSIMKERGSIMWEVNIWYLIYLENPELFSVYISDHNPSMLIKY